MADEQQYFHLSGALLATGSVIEPGNWGRVIRAYGWQHNFAMREMALEQARLAEFRLKPSRMDCCFAFISREDAVRFRATQNGWGTHILYRVSLLKQGCLSHVTEQRLCAPQGALRPDWARVYWLEFEDQAAAVPGMDWNAAINNQPFREFLTLSPLVVEEKLS